MIVYIRIVRIMLNGLLKCLESRCRVTLLHMNAGDLHPALCERRQCLDRLLKILLCSLGIAPEELVGAPNIQSLGLAFCEGDALVDSLVYQSY